MVQDVCAEHGVPCRENITLMDALRSHYRSCSSMGQKPATVAAPAAAPAL